MGTNYRRYLRRKPYSFKDIMRHYAEIRKKYENVSLEINKNIVSIYVSLQPTEESLIYRIKIVATVWKPMVSVFVVEPDISKYARGALTIPHTYSDGAICLFYPPNNEWDYDDSWADTLVPWASLWLYYFELWLATGEWLGEGIHPRNERKINSDKN